MNNMLTVLIPTYNRKSMLTDTLIALSRNNDQDFNVLISDNASNYSIEEEIFPLLSVDFLSRVKIHRQKFNIGGNINIIGLLSLCETEWGWMLSDDDIIQPNAISIIRSTLREYKNVDVFWFSVNERITKDFILHNMEQLQEFLINLNNAGDFIYCANKVYKISSLTAMDNAYNFAYTAIPQCIPICEILKKNCKLAIIKHDKVPVVYRGITDVSDNTFCMVNTMRRTIMDYPTGLSWKQHCLFVKYTFVSPIFLLNQYLKLQTLPWNYQSYLKNIYSTCFCFCYPLYLRILVKPIYWLASYVWGWELLKQIRTYFLLPCQLRLKNFIKKFPSLHKYIRNFKRKIRI